MPPQRIRIAVDGLRARARTWRVANEGASALRITEAWHPHSRFHSSRLRRDVRVAPGRAATLEMPARIDAAHGGIENAFLILRAVADRRRWRILARVTVAFGSDGTPRIALRAVDVHPADR